MIKNFFRNYLLQPICYIAIILITLFILNQFTYFNLSLGSSNTYNSFEVIGTGKVSTTPTKASTTFTVQATGTTQELARENVNKIQNQAISALTSLGIQKSNITTNISVNPNYESEPAVQPLIYPPSRTTQNGYMAVATTQVKNSDISQINKAIDSLTTLGANVGGVDYDTSDQTTLTNQAQTKAIQNAKEQAQNIAKAAGFKLGKIISVRNADDPGYMPYSADMMKSSIPSSGGTNLEPGSSEVTSKMGVTFEIND